LQTALVFAQLGKIFQLCGTRRFTTIFTSACKWILSWASRIQSAPLHTF